jgi:SOS response associated peptidase (SRAP)
MSVAGVWESWRPGTPEERRSFSIMTTAANRFMREIHDRMPVILDRSAVEDWLSPEVHERKALEEILQPCPNEWLTAVEVSSLVNSAKNKTRDVLDPGARSRLAQKAAFLRIKSQDSSGRTLTSDLSGQATLGFISPISRFYVQLNTTHWRRA